MNPGEDTYSVPETAKILNVTPGRVRQLLDAGELDGQKDGGRWRVAQRSVHARLEDHPRTSRQAAQDDAESAAELRARVEHLQYQLGRLEGQRELEATTRSTLQEQLDRERRRADEERQRADELQARLDAERERASRGFWARLFGGRGDTPT